jgi:predicted dinucleotide-binding enzyme
LPESKIVKALNTVGNPQMVKPDFQGGPPTMFLCGNDKDAKMIVADSILMPFGWEIIDIGGIEGSRLLEPLAMLWITYYFRTNTGNHAFKLLRKQKHLEKHSNGNLDFLNDTISFFKIEADVAGNMTRNK